MAGLMATRAVGRWAHWVDNVDGNSPATSGFVVVLLVAGHEAAAVLQDYADLAALLVPAANAEPVVAGYARVVYDDTVVGPVTETPASNKQGWTLPDDLAALTGVAAGADISAAVICYAPDTGGADGTFVPMHVEEFAADVSTNGSDFDYDFPAADLLSATAS